ncbi:MAG: iron-regulated protein [Bacteroidetes bacterium]|nr:MAG: iron-regulated protein [Bacteroidota bacterium]
MKKTITIILVLAFFSFAFKSDKPAYMLYNQQGKHMKYEKMMKSLVEADIVFFGELHTDPISHWLQIEMTKDLFAAKGDQLVLGAEMFESDNQLILDEYLQGAFAEKKFKADIRLWGNYNTDYRPLVEFAKENELDFIATNIPRRYASVVHKKGFEGLDELSDEARQYIGPDLAALYDPSVPSYDAMLHMEGMPAHVTANFPKAQAAKDATMAHFILENWNEGQLFFHYNGAYHSNDFEGIVWWINKLKPGLNIQTVAVTQQAQLDSLEAVNKDVANFVVVIPDNMTMTNR